MFKDDYRKYLDLLKLRKFENLTDLLRKKRMRNICVVSVAKNFKVEMTVLNLDLYLTGSMK
jgi:hypothetical protein